MSNDAKFWTARIATWLALGIDSSIMARLVGEGFKTKGAHVAFWSIIFAVSVILTMPIVMLYYHYKAERWSTASRDLNRIEVETLAAAGRAQQQATNEAKTGVPGQV